MRPLAASNSRPTIRDSRIAQFDLTECERRESPLFSDAEKVALEWTEALTTMGPEGVSDALYERARAHFSEVQLSELSFAAGVINLWNRLNIGFRNGPGSADEMLGLTKPD